MKSELTIIDGEYKFEVFEDQDAYRTRINDFHFDSEEDKRKYFLQFELGYLTWYVVIASKKVDCCNCPNCKTYEQTDCLGGIDAETPQDALEIFMVDLCYNALQTASKRGENI